MRLPFNSRLLVAKFWQSQQLHVGFRLLGGERGRGGEVGGVPNPCVVQGSTIFCSACSPRLWHNRYSFYVEWMNKWLDMLCFFFKSVIIYYIAIENKYTEQYIITWGYSLRIIIFQVNNTCVIFPMLPSTGLFAHACIRLRISWWRSGAGHLCVPWA